MPKAENRIFWTLVYALIGGLIFILGLNLLHWIPSNLRDAYKLGLPVLLLAAYLAAKKYLPRQETVFLAFFLVAAGWALDFFLTGRLKAVFRLENSALSGLAYTMVISTVLVSAVVIAGWLLAGQNFQAIFLNGSRKAWGIAAGLLGLLLFGGLGVLQAIDQGLTLGAAGAALPLALVFSLANGFREELTYRAVFLKGFQANTGPLAAVLVTTLIFTLAHVNVSYTPASQIVFVIVLVIIGITGSWIMLKTDSLAGAVLFHAGADVLLVMGMLASGQLTGR